ncbi:hypothetical protein C8J56DRAFT_471342 [Mycena floridula]|nr:hypothetical protein C8J56DRAFT_471342 [Mycena floridula]
MFTPEESAALFGVFKDLQNISLQSFSPSIGKIIGMKYESWIANGYLLAHDNEGEKQARLYMISELPLFEKNSMDDRSVSGSFPVDLLDHLCRVYTNTLSSPKMARKIASYHLDSLSLMNLRQSDRFKRIIEGVITFEFLQPLAPRCDTFSVDLSDATMLEAVTNAHRAFSESDVQNLALDADIFNFVPHLQTMLQNNAPGGLYQEVIHSELYVHPEITMLHHVQRSQAQIFRYIAVSKLCCNMCTRYFRYRGEVFEIEPVGTLGSHGKHYPGWVLPDCDSETEVHSNVIHHCLLRGH